ncbi:hypothetical protein HDU99_006669, partial [Rhizoclosmatium hyalinum]
MSTASRKALESIGGALSGIFHSAKAALKNENGQTGADLIRDPNHTRGTAFTLDTRRAKHLEGLLPPSVESLDVQVARVVAHLDALQVSPLAQYEYLDRVRTEDPTLFFKVVMSNLRKVVSIIYTPTVGLACQEFSHIYTPGNCPGLFLSLANKDRLDDILANWPGPDPDICVMTDGSRILGL